MSNDCSGLPGMRTAFSHLVCVVVGAPGPAQSAARAASVVTRITPPITARVSTAASTVAENGVGFGILFSFAWSSANTGEDFRVMTQPPPGTATPFTARLRPAGASAETEVPRCRGETSHRTARPLTWPGRSGARATPERVASYVASVCLGDVRRDED